MKQLLPLIVLLSYWSCGYNENPAAGVLFAGEIVNPTNDYVVLYKNDKVVDSAKLDDNNRFKFRLNAVEEGLHHFDHAPQLQYIYLEEGDSVRIRLNASPAYFDESLTFSGDNEDINNFMIEMFLTYEDEEPLVYSFFKLPPKTFCDKIDSLRYQKLQEFEALSQSENISPRALAMAKAAVDYHSFLYKEKYPFYHKMHTGEEIILQLDADFYRHRSLLNFNNEDLSYFRPYYDFMKYYFKNLAYVSCSQQCGHNDLHFPKKQLHLNKHKIAMIDSLVETPDLRDNLLRNVAMDYLLKVHTANKDCDSFIAKFEDLSSNEAHITEIKDLYNGIKKLQPEEELPHLVLENVRGESITLKEIADKTNTVFYFWTADQKRHFRNVSRRIDRLKKAYPKHQFIGINLRTNRKEWLSLLNEGEGPLMFGEQYRSPDFKTTQNTLIVDHLNKCIVAKKTRIIDGFANVYTSFDAQQEKHKLKMP
ncbi:MAG: transaldolase [Bacteroidota bacterium]